MTKKSNLTLDKRIKSIDDIQTCLEYDDKFINEKGYFFDNFVQAKNLTECHYGRLVDICGNNSDDNCFKVSYESWNERIDYFRFFIPESLLKPVENKYRPFSIEDWKLKHSIGETILYRYNGTYCDDHREAEVMYLGYVKPLDGVTDVAGKGELILGNESLGLQNLFNNYEMWVNGDWQPFGVLDD